MVMAIQYDAVVGLDDRNQWREVRLIGGDGHVRVMQLQELPVRIGILERRLEEVNLHLLVRVAVLRVAVVVHGCVLLVRREEAVRIHDHKCRRPVTAFEVVRVILFAVGRIKEPPTVVDGSYVNFEVHAVFTPDYVVVSDALIPSIIFEYALAIHVDPSLFKTENPAGGKGDAGVVKVVANGDEGTAVLNTTDLSNVLCCVHLQCSRVEGVASVARVTVIDEFIWDCNPGSLELRHDL